MLKTDPQLKSNDCGISSIKTIFNLYGKNISRKYIVKNVPLEEKGSRISDMKKFFNANGFTANFKLLDVNYINGNIDYLQDLFPFILPIQNKKGLHYVVVNGLKDQKLKIFDPGKGSQYYLSLQEIKKMAHFTENHWDLADTREKITTLCSQELSDYHINIENALIENGPAELFNKLTYFSYLKDAFGFKDIAAEKDFLNDLLKNQEISSVPRNFKTLKFNKDKIKNTSPLILVVKPNPEKENLELPKEESPNLYWKLFRRLGKFKKLWYIYIFAALFSASTAQIAVFTNQILIDNVLPSYNLNTLVLFAIGLGIYKIFDIITTIYKSFVGIHLGNILDKYFLFSFDQKINNSSLSYIHSYKKGDLMERISDALKLKSFFLKFFTSILVDIFVSVYSLGILFFINKMLTLVVVGVMILFFLWFKFITPSLKQNERLRYMRKADFLSKMMEKVEGIQVIKSFKIEQFHSDKVFGSINEYLKIQLKNGYIDLINKIVVALIVIVSSVFIMVYLTKSAMLTQLITLGQIVTFIALSSKIFSSLKSILDDNLSLQENEVILKRYFDFDEENKKTSKKGISDFNIENIQLQNLNYGYLPNEYVLKNINLQIDKKEKIKIEGQNGSGKSTFSKVLTTLYLPDSGTILINERDRKFYNDDRMKDKILLVTTEDILFNDTIQNNIALGREIPILEIIDKAKQIDFYDFIASKEEGLDFIINENGKNFSTGQRKKILLLRALFSKAEIIILDEVLSGMDNESRKKVEILINNDDSKTYIIISHEAVNHINFSKKYKIQDGELILL
ncbi:ATP-binding cassette domain-containing protein [Flavobacterium sp.]|uniref:ATP-binding cassette domain-containing protein n=1 Tax=Flavobacterium sp. TaxID=239 RepID=UPI002B4B519B|nr:ABC transporter transmembrane domain-containing protein [Flavobacterium sp.]HLF52720.1 ABC transporter transmembrane domain-containing protein [Flavobacterium sp.]